MKLFDTIINAKLILDTAKSLGAEVDDLNDKISILNDNNEFAVKSIPYETIRELLFIALQRTGSKRFWLDMAIQFDKKEMLGVLAYSTCTLPTAKDAMEYGYDVLSRLSNILAIELSCTEVESAFIIQPQTNDDMINILIDFHMANFTKITRMEVDKNFQPIRLELQHSGPEDPSSYTNWFCCPILFNQARNALVFDVGILNVPLINSDESLHKALEPFADSLKERIKACHTTAEQTSTALVHLLPKKSFHINDVASLLNMSVRSLQQELNKEQTSFQNLLDQIRMEHAVARMQNTNSKLSNVAEELGFSDISSFSRAFKRWTGQSPKQYTASTSHQ